MGREISWTFDYLWHDLGGMGINGLLVGACVLFGLEWWVPFALGVPMLTAWGLAREFEQHPDGLTPHRCLEGVLWGVGALQGALIGLIWLL
jgi:hypothetical protein